MNPRHCLSVLFCAALLAGATALVACETATPTHAVIDNAYPAVPEGGDPAAQTVVYRAWWVATYFPDPVAGGGTSAEQRGVPASEIAYAVLAPGWDPAGTEPPSRFIAVKSKTAMSVARGDVLHIVVSDESFTGNCLAGQPLSQEDADFITQSIFPGEFANVTYDAKTCTSTPLPEEDAGTDAGTDAADAGPG